MTAPYREASGTLCPRCAQVLLERGDGSFACASGCGEWLSNATLMRRMGTTEIRGLGRRGMVHKAMPLPPTRCLVCRAGLEDLYTAVTSPSDMLTLGQCAAHGVWVERRAATVLDAAYSGTIARHRTECELADAVRSGDPSVAKLILSLVDRIAALEDRLASLENRL